MKKFLLIAMFLATVSTSFGQVTVENVNMNKLDIQYCQLIGISSYYLERSINITVDYGQEYKANKSQEIKGPNGKIMEFSSMIAALNLWQEMVGTMWIIPLIHTVLVMFIAIC